MPKKLKTQKQTATSSTSRSQRRRSDSQRRSRRSLAQISGDNVTTHLPRHLKNKTTGTIRKKAISIGDDQSSHSAVLWRDADGPKMYLNIRENNPQRLRAELANDIKKVRESKEQDVFQQGEGFPDTLHVDMGNANPAETERIVRAAFQQSGDTKNQSLHLTESVSDGASDANGANGATSLSFSISSSFFKLRADFFKVGLSRHQSQLSSDIQTRLAEAESMEAMTVATRQEKAAQLDFQLAIMSEINDLIDEAQSGILSTNDRQALNDLKQSLEQKAAVLINESTLLKSLTPVIPADPYATAETNSKQTPPPPLTAPPPEVVQRAREISAEQKTTATDSNNEKGAKNMPENDMRPQQDQATDSLYDVIPVIDDISATGEYGPAPDLNDPALSQPRQNAVYAGFPKTTEIMSVKAFKQAASGSFLSRRSDGYKKTLAALENYHATLSKLSTEARANQSELADASTEKNRLLAQKRALESEKNSKQKAILLRNSDIRRFIDESRHLDLNDATDKAKFDRNESAIKKMAAENQINRKEVAVLDSQIQALDVRIQIEDQTVIGPLLDKSKTTLRRHRQLLNAQSVTLRESATSYRQDKENSANSVKKRALDNVIQQVESPNQDTLRVNETVNELYGVDYNHLPSEPMQALPSDTASEVYRVTLNGNIGTTQSRSGFAKKNTDSENDTTINLGFIPSNGTTDFRDVANSRQHPNLIARQMLSSRVATQLRTQVIAPEVFSRAHDGSILGVTGMARGQAMMNRTTETDIYPFVDLTNPATQKGLAELQIVDAINGQLDRHLGNVFIYPATGEVTGIDNDMAYPTDRAVSYTGNTLTDQFSEEGTGANKKLVYNQSQIPNGIGERIIAMDRSKLEKTLRGKPQDPQHIDEAAIQHTLKRFDAVKARCLQLQQAGKLIDDNGWNDDTYQQSLYSGFVKDGDDSTQHTNYIARAAYKYDEAGRNDNTNVQLPADFP